MGININDMRQNAYQAIFGDKDVGATTNGSTKIIIGPNRVAIEDAEQARGAIKLWRVGMIARVEMVIKEIAPAVLAEILLPGLEFDTNGSKVAYYLGNETKNLDPFARRLRIHPVSNDLSDTTDDWVFWRALSVQEFTYSGNNESPQDVSITFEVLPDFNKSVGRQIGVHNNWEIEQGVPLGVWNATSKAVKSPPKHLTGLDLDLQEVQQLENFELQGDISATITAEMNGAITATALSMTVDTLSIDGGIIKGSILILDSAGAKELVKVISVTRINATEATYGIQRGICGSIAVAHLTDVTIEQISQPSVYERTLDSEWTSSIPAVIEIGNTYNSNLANKGEITRLTAGVSNVISTFGGKASPATVVTGL